MKRETLQHPKFFTALNSKTWRCEICPQPQAFMKLSIAIRHESTAEHAREVRRRDYVEAAAAGQSTVHEGFSFPPPFERSRSGEPEHDRGSQLTQQTTLNEGGAPSQHTFGLPRVEDQPFFDLCDEMYQSMSDAEQFMSQTHLQAVHGPALEGDDFEQIYDNWGGLLAAENAEDSEGDDDDDDEGGSQLDAMRESAAEADVNLRHAPDFGVDLDFTQLQKLMELGPDGLIELDDKEEWSPWKDKESCLMDILGAFPRAVFSESEMSAAKWFAERHGASGLPDVKQVKRHRETILKAAGLDPTTHESSMGDRYTSCKLERIVQDEFSNPLVRPFIFTYAEDSNGQLSEARQASKWLWEVDPNAGGPMARSKDGKDYFVNEVAMANLDELGRIGPVMVQRWFMRDQRLMARVTPLLIDEGNTGYVLDERPGAMKDVAVDAFFLDVTDMASPIIRQQYRLPETDVVKEQIQAKAKAVREELKHRQQMSGAAKSELLKAALRELRESLPESLFNPTLLIPDFDPNQDSPFEMLHVVLLGVVKYFWRDAVSRQTADGKETLKARLTSVNVAGLDINPLRAHTLVQYAGSLVGRDFRSILQPEIANTAEYFNKLESRVYDFLAATALWTTRWFNKPKFHLFLHLMLHIKRFGPALLCSTEGFESYNAVIRLRSIHSNRHAPSKDIAEAFSFLHAVRHLYAFIQVESIICAVNVLHNCAKHKCGITRTRAVVQERQKTGMKDNEVTHKHDQDDLVLNLAQMRNAAVLQYLQADAQHSSQEHPHLLRKAVKIRDQLDAKEKAAASSSQAKNTKKRKSTGTGVTNSAEAGGGSAAPPKKRTQARPRGGAQQPPSNMSEPPAPAPSSSMDINSDLSAPVLQHYQYPVANAAAAAASSQNFPSWPLTQDQGLYAGRISHDVLAATSQTQMPLSHQAHPVLKPLIMDP
ncbi:hypothetical protein EVJ58_g5640 [Rhodofomes roseus]|uniref:Uncharacterized protein n=1 Tax=Rhodofomes roseus TaxID=34475 RepID=A0A4Y9YBH5_9APHY|nr:hypothetical protein EVJ58_g5640 [Rhodofomes roseus]